MKKCIAFFMIFALLLTFVLVVGAEAENEPVAGEDAEGEVLTPPVEEVPVDEPETDEGWASQAMEWVAENYSGLAVALAALWAVIPKVGGIAMLVRMLAKVAALFTVLKKYIDDEGNENSIYNVMKRQGQTIAAFMNDMAPLLQELREGKLSTDELKAELLAARDVIAKQQGFFLAVEEAVELMAAEFNDLISISTTISAKKKAELEQKWLDAEAHLRNAVKEATNEQAGEEASA